MSGLQRIYCRTSGHMQVDSLMVHNYSVIPGSWHKMNNHRWVDLCMLDQMMVGPRFAKQGGYR